MYTAPNTAPTSSSEEKEREKKESADSQRPESASSYDVFVNKQREETAAYAQAQTLAIHNKPTPSLLS